MPASRAVSPSRVGTVKNHRHSIYGKLDITTEREMFLQYFDFRAWR